MAKLVVGLTLANLLRYPEQGVEKAHANSSPLLCVVLSVNRTNDESFIPICVSTS